MAEILAAPRPVAPAAPTTMAPLASAPALETVPENSKSTSRGHAKSESVSTTNGANTNGDFPVKTDKPRPHVCLTCKRSFARLEHLKRHERSHTKEKPFECPECTRCFARRDLLLRHQQKLHMTTTPSSRPRAGRRESTSSTMSGTGKIRKNSTTIPASMRPRANTISHVGNPALDMFANGHMVADGMHQPPMVMFGLQIQEGMGEVPRPPQVPGHHGLPNGLPKLNTSLANHDLMGGLRTAPAFDQFNMDTLFSPDTTVNPAALHFPDAPQTASLETPSPFQDLGMHGSHMGGLDMEQGMDWMSGFGHDLHPFNTNDSNAIGGSSPSVMDSDSPDGASEHALDRTSSMPQHTTQWQTNPFAKTANVLPDYMMDMGLSDAFPQGPPSPSAMPDFAADGHFTNPQFHVQHPFGLNGVPNFMGPPYPPMNHPDSPSTMASVTEPSGRPGSVGSGRRITIPEATRHAIMVTLAQPGAMFGQRKTYSQPTISSPLSPGFASKAQVANTVPSTPDLQRYIAAYIRFFHAHIPILHIPTLSFDTPLPSGFQANGRSNSPVFNVANGGGCLILAMSSIGALYENDIETSKTLFHFSKKVLATYLEERRKADISSAINPMNTTTSASTPVWLVQSMLLNVIYGHMCGDKTSEISAHTHSAALISLARAANLTVPASKQGPQDSRDEKWNPRGEDPAWYEWRIAEEKKRTLFACFNISSLLTAAYNHPPALKNTEVTLDLPCDEDLWAADSAETWYGLGGSMAAEQNNVPFGLALSRLLSVHERQQLPIHQMSQAFCKPQIGEHEAPGWPRAEFHASTFGCVVLINALHNYIWETRQRHIGRSWTPSETEDMYRRIEPALIAWQAVWSQISHHSVEHPNPHGMGPLAADSIPLLDLAYLNLYVNLGHSKECFWQRDFDEMARQIDSGFDGLQLVGHDGESQDADSDAATEQHQADSRPRSAQASQKASRRERHLRKAAFHAANSLVLSGRAGSTYADFGARELSLQAALCQFECSQVLAEWLSTLQERVGPYLGILGLDPINVDDVPAIIMLEPEDIQLMGQVDEILHTAETKMRRDPTRFGVFPAAESPAGYSTKVLQTISRMLDKSSVWPVLRNMSAGLEVQAHSMRERAERSKSRT